MSNQVKCPVCDGEYKIFLANHPKAYRDSQHYLCEPVRKIFEIIDTYYTEPEASEITKLIENLIQQKLEQRL